MNLFRPKHIAVSILLAFSALSATSAVAESKVMAFNQDSRLKQFNYDENDTYTINTRPGINTDLQMNSDEIVESVYAGDTVQWVIEVDPHGRHVFIKPTAPDLFTNATIITNKRTYQLLMKSHSSDDKFYARVSWQDQKLIAYQNKQAVLVKQREDDRVAIEKEARERKDADARETWEMGTSVDDLNFNYEVSGRGSFKPVQVFDNGRFTWLRFEANLQELPAVFAPGDDGKYEIVNYVVKENMFMVQKVMPTTILKIGKAEVKIVNKALTKSGKSTFSFWN